MSSARPSTSRYVWTWTTDACLFLPRPREYSRRASVYPLKERENLWRRQFLQGGGPSRQASAWNAAPTMIGLATVGVTSCVGAKRALIADCWTRTVFTNRIARF